MSVTFQSGQDILCLEIEDEDKKIINWKKKVKNLKNFSYSSFVFAFYTLISPNLQIIFFKLRTRGRFQKSAPILKISKKLDVNSRNGTLIKTQKHNLSFMG